MSEKMKKKKMLNIYPIKWYDKIPFIGWRWEGGKVGR